MSPCTLCMRCFCRDPEFYNEPADNGPSAGQIFIRAEQRKSTPVEEEPQQKAQEKDPKTRQDNLDVGDKVLIKHQQTGCWNKEAEVVEQRNDKLSYVIRDNR